MNVPLRQHTMPKTCSRPGCDERAIAQLSYAYALSRVEVHPVGDDCEPGEFLLCQAHLDRFTLPKGWRLVAHDIPAQARLTPADLTTLADAIRQAGGVSAGPAEPEGTEMSLSSRTNLVTLAARAHLRVVADSARYDTTGLAGK